MERQHLVAHLERTGSWLVDEVSGLSPAQLRFRPATDEGMLWYGIDRTQHQWLLLISSLAQRHIPRRAFTTAS